MRLQKDHLGAILLASFIVISFSALLLIVGPRGFKNSKYNSKDWLIRKDKKSLYKKILPGEIGRPDTLLMVINHQDTLLREIPFSRKIKFSIDTTVKGTRRVVLRSLTSKKPITFLLLTSIWLGLHKREFRRVERF